MQTPSDAKSKRPLSPHLQVYKLPYNAVMSITGRAVGVALSLAFTILLLVLICVSFVPGIYTDIMAFLTLPFMGYVFLLGAFVVFFYIGNGIRHVLWDMTIGVHHKTGKLTGNIVLIVSAILTAGLWFLNAGL